MAKRQKDHAGDHAPQQRPSHYPPPRQGVDALATATLVGVVALLMISFSNWRELDRIEEGFGDRLGKIETQVARVSERVSNLPTQAPAAQPARRGPDPSRVYQIKTDAAPAKGPASAPVTIAEFSDFQ